jgi:hypothetical protein
MNPKLKASGTKPLKLQCEYLLLSFGFSFNSRHYIRGALAAHFRNPDKLKVLHGSDMDVQWLQRDFGIYVVGRCRLKAVYASTEPVVLRLGSLTQHLRVILCDPITCYSIELAWFHSLKPN